MIVGLFVVMSVLIIYNTTRISIFVFRNEIGVMKLVGASNFFIRGPFLVEAGISGAISAVVATIISYPISYYISTKSLTFLGGFDILRYYESNVLLLFVILFIFSFIVSIISSFLATRKYLKR
jgi:cell division transport system permease protein